MNRPWSMTIMLAFGRSRLDLEAARRPAALAPTTTIRMASLVPNWSSFNCYDCTSWKSSQAPCVRPRKHDRLLFHDSKPKESCQHPLLPGPQIPEQHHEYYLGQPLLQVNSLILIVSISHSLHMFLNFVSPHEAPCRCRHPRSFRWEPTRR